MYLFIAGMIVGAPLAVPVRIDAEPVSVWFTTGGLVDDRPPQLTVDPSVFTMENHLADGSGWPAEFETGWSDIAADLAKFDGEEAPSGSTDAENGNESKSAVESETGPEIRL